MVFVCFAFTDVRKKLPADLFCMSRQSRTVRSWPMRPPCPGESADLRRLPAHVGLQETSRTFLTGLGIDSQEIAQTYNLFERK
eukprot:16218324-Heterocapsa_arctica.AAC.1